MGYSKSNYEFLKSRGICTKCGKNKAVNKTTYCEYCLEKDVIKNAKYREKNRAVLRRKNKERMQKLRDRRKENRECTKCGKKLNPLYDGNYVKCKICRHYHMEYMKKRRSEEEKQCSSRKERNKDRVEKGLCLHCNKQALNGYKLCEKHYKISINGLSKAHENINNHIWRKYDSAIINKKMWHKENGK